MAVTRPFAFNTGSTIPGTIQVGNLAIGVDAYDYSEQPGGIRWWNGPDEELGYVIAHETLSGNQPNPLDIPAFLGFWRTEGFDESLFISLSEWVAAKDNDPQNFSTGDDAKLWLNNNGYWTSFGESPQPENLDNPIITENSEYIEVGNGYYLMFVDSTPIATPTPTPTASLAVTPTPTPQPVTGYSFNLVELPYDFPTSGNTIMNNEVGVQSGSTNPNALSTSSRGLYWNAIDSDGIDRTSYFSEFTGQSITITISQTGSTAIYSGDSDSLKQWVTSPTESGFVFGTGIGVPPSVTPSGTATLIQSATTEWNYGVPVYISVTINTPGATPTPTPTASEVISPTQTPTPTSSSVISPTPTPTPTITPTSGFTITITESGSNVVMSASGTLNINDLSLVASGSGPLGQGGIGISTATFIIGASGSTFDQYSGFTTTPTNFGSGAGSGSSSGNGDIVGVIIDSVPPYILVVPNGYVSGTYISSTQTFNNQTLSGMGLINGTYTYTWGSGANEDSIQVVIGGSSPSPTPTPTATSGTVGDGWLFYGSEGPITVGPPIADGNVVFTDNDGGPILETFNPNKSSGTDFLYFNVRDTSGFDYTTQFSNLQTNGGTINITQNGDTATYVLGPNMAVVNTIGGGSFLQINASMGTQTVSSTSPFVSGTPITITII